jgi:hypothetical protein
LRLIGYFLPKIIPLLIQVSHRNVSLGNRAVIRYLYWARYPFIMSVVRHGRAADDPRGSSGTPSSSTPAFASLRSHSGNPESFREFGTIPPWKRWPPLAGDVAHPHESQGFQLSSPFVMRLAQGLLCSMARKDKRKRMGGEVLHRCMGKKDGLMDLP